MQDYLIKDRLNAQPNKQAAVQGLKLKLSKEVLSKFKMYNCKLVKKFDTL